MSSSNPGTPKAMGGGFTDSIPGLAIAIGAGIGLIFGLALDQLFWGLTAGAAAGVVFGTLLWGQRSR